MTSTEAAKVVAELVGNFPGSRFNPDNTEAYERHLGDLEYGEARAAVSALALTDHFIPTIAKIRDEVFRARRNERQRQAVPKLAPPTNGPGANAWAYELSKQLSAAEKYERMVKSWYEKHGKRYPGDPAKPIVDMVQAGARGEDVSAEFQRRVMGERE